MKKIALLLIVALSLNSSCKRSTKFIYLDKLRDEDGTYFDNKLRPYLFEYVLIDNPPDNKDSLKKIIIAYCDTSLAYRTKIEQKYYIYFIRFFRKSCATSCYIKAVDGCGDWTAHSDIDDESEDYLGEYHYNRCSNVSEKGRWTITFDIQDFYEKNILIDECKEKKEYVYPLN